MAATVELKVNVDAQKAIAELQRVYTSASNIEKLSPIEIKVEIPGIDSATKETIALAKEHEKLQRSENELERSRVIHTKSTKQNTDANIENASSLKDIDASAKKANSSVGLFAATLAHQLANRAINSVRKAFSEALTTMREVDAELANIQKVTDESDAAIAKVGDTAYDAASKYGVAANEYLESSAAFAKAGYDNYTQMAELATKTQLVGDVNAEIASKFLLSADAAFKFGGNMEDLSSVLDKANIIENNYATSIEKLAQGFPLVAATASMANMTVDETLAALGTITAKTQESGTMAARALRALILNILGDTQTEIEDGVTWTKKELKSLNGLLWKYAEEPMRQARANGTVVNPMEAIRALHEAYATGVLTQKEITDLAMNLGGKLRTNQLVALIENYDTFTEMLGKTADSAGSADKEIEVMLGTWDAKVNQLKNSWTELVSSVLDTSLVKGAIDEIRSGVESATGIIQEIKNALSAPDYTQALEDANSEMESLRAKGAALTDIEKRRLAYLEYETQELEKQKEIQDEQTRNRLMGQYVSGATGYTRYDDAGNFTGKPRSVAADEEYLVGLFGNLKRVREEWISGALTIEEYREKLAGIRDENSNIQDILTEYEALGGQLNDFQRAFVESWSGLNEAVGATDAQIQKANSSSAEASDSITTIWRTAGSDVQTFGEKESEAANEANAISENVSGISFDSAIDGASKLLGLLIRSSSIGFDFATGGYGGFATGTKNAPGGPTLVNELGPELISDNGRAYIANGGMPGVVNLHPGAIVLTAQETKKALSNGFPIYAAAAGFQNNMSADVRGGWLGTSYGGGGAAIHYTTTTAVAASTLSAALADQWNNTAHTVQDEDALLMAALEAEWEDRKNSAEYQALMAGETKKRSSGSGKKTAAAVAKSVEELAKETSDLLSNLDKQAKLANNAGEYVKEAELYEQAQEAIKQMVDDYRKAGYADDSNEILDLLNKNYDYANKQLSLYQTKWDELIKALEADTDAQELANKLAEKQQAVEDAREALANAQKQRTIRMYNAATGQWEWVADESKISSAQEKLASAEESYADEVKSQAIKELEAMRDTVADLNDVVLGPALSAVALMAENSTEFQNFARALNAVYGVGSYLQSTEGSSNVISTADSHDTIYTFGNVTLTEEQASGMSVAELAQKLQVLKIS